MLQMLSEVIKNMPNVSPVTVNSEVLERSKNHIISDEPDLE
jgi:hypothetical protein